MGKLLDLFWVLITILFSDWDAFSENSIIFNCYNLFDLNEHSSTMVLHELGSDQLDQPNSVVLKMNSERGQWKSEVTRYILMSLVASTQHWAAGPCNKTKQQIADVILMWCISIKWTIAKNVWKCMNRYENVFLTYTMTTIIRTNVKIHGHILWPASQSLRSPDIRGSGVCYLRNAEKILPRSPFKKKHG